MTHLERRSLRRILRTRYSGVLTTRTMVRRILATCEGSTAEQRDAGLRWYGRFRGIAETIARAYGVDVETVAGVLAILSPRVSVSTNVVLTAAAIRAHVDGREVRDLPGLGERLDAAARYLEGDTRPLDLDAHGKLTSARKVRSFARNILGDLDAVTVDVWAARVAGCTVEQPNGGAYVAVADAYRRAARRLGVSPRECQAWAWCAIRSDIDATEELAALQAAVSELVGGEVPAIH